MHPLIKLGLSLVFMTLAGPAVADSRYAVLPLFGGDVPDSVLSVAQTKADELIAGCEKADEAMSDCLDRRQLVQRSLGRTMVTVVQNHLPASAAEKFGRIDAQMRGAIESRRSKCSRFGDDQAAEKAQCKLLQYVQRNALLRLSLNRARDLVEAGSEPVAVTAHPYAALAVFGGNVPLDYDEKLEAYLYEFDRCNLDTGIKRKICMHAEMSQIARAGNDDLEALLTEVSQTAAERIQKIDSDFLDSVRSGEGECASKRTGNFEDPELEQFLACVIPALARRTILLSSSRVEVLFVQP